MSILDEYLETYHYSEYHEIMVQGTPEQVYPHLKKVDFADSKIIRTLFRLRGFQVGTSTLQDFLSKGFTLLREDEPNELVLGFTARAGKICFIDPGDFKGFNEPGCFKGAWNFHLQSEETGQTRLSTETRVFCIGRKSKRIFSIYWFFIRPFSGWIRRIMLKIVKRAVEKS